MTDNDVDLMLHEAPPVDLRVAVARARVLASVANLIDDGIGVSDLPAVRITGFAGFESEEP